MSFLLLFGAGLFVRSLQNLKTTDTGVALDNLVTFQLSPALSGYDDERAVIFYRQLLERLRAAPGVKSAAIAAVSILSGDEWDSSMSVEGHTGKDGEDMQAFMNALSPGYFETMKIPILEGRDFRPSDVKKDADGRDRQPPVRRALLPGQERRRQAHRLGRRPEDQADDRDHRRRRRLALRRAARRRAPAGLRAELGQGQRGVLRAHATRRPRAAATCIRNEVKQLDAAMPVYEMKTVEGQLDETLLTDRLIALLSAGFGLLATLLASIGLYGVMAFVVARRRKELGIRLALGAPRGVVIWLVMSEVLLLLGIGLAIGIPAAMALGPLRRPRSSTASRPAIRGSPGSTMAAADGRLGRGRPDSGAPRQPHRSDPRAALRVGIRPDRAGCRVGIGAQRGRRTSAVRQAPNRSPSPITSRTRRRRGEAIAPSARGRRARRSR